MKCKHEWQISGTSTRCLVCGAKKKKPLSWKSNAEKGNAYGAYRV